MATTDRDLTNALTDLNAAAGTPLEPLGPNYVWNIGSFIYDKANGGYQLEQVVGTSGASRSFGGFGTKLELLLRIEAMIDGITVAKGGK